MTEKFSISKTALGELINAFLPRDDDSGPWGPFGPVIRDRLLWILLNPQPLPPKTSPQPDPWHWFSGPVLQPWLLGTGPHPHPHPHPQPWRSVELVRFVIDKAVLQYQLAEVVVGTEQLKRSTETIGSMILRFVDEFCGTKPPRLPWPPKFSPKELHPLDFLIVGTEFQRAADAIANEPLQEIFSAAADQLLETGLKRLESLGCEKKLTE